MNQTEHKSSLHPWANLEKTNSIKLNLFIYIYSTSRLNCSILDYSLHSQSILNIDNRLDTSIISIITDFVICHKNIEDNEKREGPGHFNNNRKTNIVGINGSKIDRETGPRLLGRLTEVFKISHNTPPLLGSTYRQTLSTYNLINNVLNHRIRNKTKYLIQLTIYDPT